MKFLVAAAVALLAVVASSAEAHGSRYSCENGYWWDTYYDRVYFDEAGYLVPCDSYGYDDGYNRDDRSYGYGQYDNWGLSGYRWNRYHRDLNRRDRPNWSYRYNRDSNRGHDAYRHSRRSDNHGWNDRNRGSRYDWNDGRRRARSSSRNNDWNDRNHAYSRENRTVERRVDRNRGRDSRVIKRRYERDRRR